MFGKVSKAIHVLVTNNYDVRNRVWVASDYLMMLDPDSVPEQCREDVVWIQHMLTRYPPDEHRRSALDATYHRTRCVTASKIAARVWKLYHVYETAFQAQARRERA